VRSTAQASKRALILTLPGKVKRIYDGLLSLRLGVKSRCLRQGFDEGHLLTSSRSNRGGLQLGFYRLLVESSKGIGRLKRPAEFPLGWLFLRHYEGGVVFARAAIAHEANASEAEDDHCPS
jgi:hypothetical protein